MSIVKDIAERLKTLIAKRKEKDDSAEGATGNPITDLYNKALTHPATTIGLLAGAVGVGAAIAFVVAERRAQKGIAREMERTSARLRRRSRRRL